MRVRETPVASGAKDANIAPALSVGNKFMFFATVVIKPYILLFVGFLFVVSAVISISAASGQIFLVNATKIYSSDFPVALIGGDAQKLLTMLYAMELAMGVFFIKCGLNSHRIK